MLVAWWRGLVKAYGREYGVAKGDGCWLVG